jgi:glycosyltransferase involved in cell wall biosynthesis
MEITMTSDHKMNKHQAIVSIIVPLYNKEKTVSRTIESILKQTFQDWRLIVVDDGSTDNGVEVVKQFQDERIRVISQENRGPGAARNRGIKEATCEYVAFLDADDQWYRWYLENSIKAIDQSDAGFVGAMYYEWPKEDDMTSYWNKRNVKEGVYEITENDSSKQLESWVLFFHVGTTIVRTTLARKYDGFYDINKCCCGEDTIFFAKLVLNEKFAITGPPAVRHNRQDSDLSITSRQPLTPLLTNPEVLLNYCPEEKKKQGRSFLVRLALLTAHHKARNGVKDDAVYLLKKYPEIKTQGFAYYKCRMEIALSRWMPCWIKFKMKVGPPTRLFVKDIAYKTGLLKRPPSA